MCQPFHHDFEAQQKCIARSDKDAQSGVFRPLQDIRLGKCAVKLYLKELDFPVLAVKKVFKNEDGSSGKLYLACSNLELDYEQIPHPVQKKVEGG